jgi:23S rRNA (cytosine1962-C5)-methyltransferase
MNAVQSSDSLPRLRLMRGADRRLQSGHLWIYSNEIDNQATPLRSFTAGQQVAVETEHRKLLGSAYINPNSLLCARLLTRDAETFGQQQLVARLRAALQMRERFFAEPYYRLVYGESDLLPGLVVDRFGPHLVVQLNTAGMDAMREQVVAALLEVMQPESILLRNDSGIRELEGLPSEVVVAHGAPPEFVEMTENGVRFRAPLRTGQKTGWFYDQRPNRAWLRGVSTGRSVLDVFSYIGSFGVQAGAFGAKSVCCVDASEQALLQAQENAVLNNFKGDFSTMQGDAFDVLRALRTDNRHFDIVIVDPPAFVKKKKDLPKGAAAYRRINEIAMELLNPDGLLIASSCSMHLPVEELVDALRSGAQRTGRHVQLLAEGMQGIDHPVHPAIPETRYLKALLARVA